MKMIEMFHLFRWCGVINRAVNILASNEDLLA